LSPAAAAAAANNTRKHHTQHQVVSDVTAHVCAPASTPNISSLKPRAHHRHCCILPTTSVQTDYVCACSITHQQTTITLPLRRFHLLTTTGTCRHFIPSSCVTLYSRLTHRPNL
jgi:hypothetical protein